ncbi:EAL domain-containing protein [Vibrio paucivorans]|uniref:EAL domain-containing protein n=1 Tax=Vibrio paucivorans TaxID=2829489 RepID=A0A9X3CHV7_9VIBR|nr:EAL domain-containing protein [Vibrio paucivorans]MCW8336143.1 EAL domain-containing protein [Vibrio paucivorans]
MNIDLTNFVRIKTGQYVFHLTDKRVYIRTAFQKIFDSNNSVVGVESLARVFFYDGQYNDLEDEFEGVEPENVLLDSYLNSLNLRERSFFEQGLLVLHILNFYLNSSGQYDGYKLFVNMHPNVALDIMESKQKTSFYREFLSRLDLDLSRLVIELTEHTCKNEQLFRHLARTKWVPKVKRAMDDVRLSDVELGRVMNLEPDIIKLDPSLTNANSHDAVLVKCTQQWRKEGIIVVAEGVESSEELERMKRLGCHWFQGYYFDKPKLF